MEDARTQHFPIRTATGRAMRWTAAPTTRTNSPPGSAVVDRPTRIRTATARPIATTVAPTTRIRPPRANAAAGSLMLIAMAMVRPTATTAAPTMRTRPRPASVVAVPRIRIRTAMALRIVRTVARMMRTKQPRAFVVAVCPKAPAPTVLAWCSERRPWTNAAYAPEAPPVSFRTPPVRIAQVFPTVEQPLTSAVYARAEVPVSCRTAPAPTARVPRMVRPCRAPAATMMTPAPEMIPGPMPVFAKASLLIASG